jgi:uncharacterized protein (DUF849 family)
MTKPVIVTCAATGSIHTPTMSPYLPITPAEIATAAIEAAEAGASVIHLHARDPETGKPDPRPETFMRFLPVIKQASDAVVNISTGGGLGMTVDERLAAAVRASPEMASGTSSSRTPSRASNTSCASSARATARASSSNATTWATSTISPGSSTRAWSSRRSSCR